MPDEPSSQDGPPQDGPAAGSPDESSEESPAPQASERAETAWQRRRRLAAVFGDVLPETTSDERDPTDERGTSDRWLREQVPPHHG